MPRPRKKASTSITSEQKTGSEPMSTEAPIYNGATQPVGNISLSPRERQEKQDAVSAIRRQQEENTDIINKFFLASKSGDVMEATVMGTMMEKNNAYWLCHYGPITIRIPFLETFEELPPALLDETLPNIGLRRRQLLSKSAGLPIRFVVTSFEPDPDNRERAIVYGSRVKAMEKIRQRYYGPDAYNPVRVGDRINALILSVSEHVIWLNVRGLDVRVSSAELSHRYLPDLNEDFAIGESITVEVTHLKINPQTGMPVLKVSLRPVEIEDAKSRHCLAPVHSQYVATITNKRIINDKKESVPRLRINLWINGVDIPGYAMSLNDVTAKDSLFTGDHVFVDVLGYTDYGYCHCKILRKAGRSI